MRAALEAAWRGHQVTLFEQQGQLGGLLQYADYVSFKWPLARYKDWLIAQLRKTAVEVRLNTQASAEDMDGYDAVIAEVGSVPVVPGRLAGAELAKTAVSVYGTKIHWAVKWSLSAADRLDWKQQFICSARDAG